jgi:hypothetical protein
MSDGLDVLMGIDSEAPKLQSGLDVLMGTPASSTSSAAKAQMSFSDRFMQGLNDVSSAGAQLLTHALPDKAVSAVNDATSFVNKLPYIGPVTQALGMVPATAKSLDADITQNEQQYRAQKPPGIDWARMGGNMLGTLPMAAALPATASIGGAAAQGTMFGALSTPVASGDFWKEKGKQVIIGGVAGGATNAALRGIASVVSPTVRPEVQTLLDAGVTPTPGQIIGGGTSRVEQAATSVPVLGDMIRNSQRRTLDQFNTAAINRSLAPIGDKLPAGSSGRDAIDYAATKLGSAYDDVLTRIGAVRPDEKFLGDLSSLGSLVQGLPKAQSDQFGRIIDSQILSRFDNNGVITGEGLKAAESNLGALAKGYGRSADFDQRQMGTAIVEAQATLRGMLARQSPQFADTLQSINTGYANLMRPQRASSFLGADQGLFTPAQLQSAVKALDPSKNNRQFATGRALMQDLSEAGKNVMGATVPDSGTPFRHAVQVGGAAFLGHSMLPEGMAGAAIPAALGLGAASLPYTKAGQAAAAYLLTQRPDFAPQLAQGLLGAAPFAPLLGATAAQGR